MAKEGKTVVLTVPAGGSVVTEFMVEYRDSQGHWCPAAGPWHWGAVCRSAYQDQQAAAMMATEIARLAEHDTRVVKVVTSGN